jgi:hypothetical protein
MGEGNEKIASKELVAELRARAKLVGRLSALSALAATALVVIVVRF